MASRNRVLLFWHEHRDLWGAMHGLNVRSKTCSQLQTFLTAACATVKQQIVTLNGSERASIGAFEDLVELAERHVSQHRPNAVIDVILFVTIQISQLLVYVYCHPKRMQVDLI